jgi:uncharacterized protein (TIGR02145 family)
MKKVNLFSCLLIGVASISYAQTVTIGTQVWMTKNLDISTFRNGAQIPQARTAEEWRKAWQKGQPAWCYYDNDRANGAKYGKLYNWYAVIDSRGLAPIGYHIPSDTEWTKLIDYLGGKDVAGTKMKSKSGWECGLEFEGNGTNTSGFLGLPSGSRDWNGNFASSIHWRGSWWSSVLADPGHGWYIGLNSVEGFVGKYGGNLGEGHSIRCLKD